MKASLILAIALAAMASARPEASRFKWRKAEPLAPGANVMSHNINMKLAEAFRIPSKKTLPVTPVTKKFVAQADKVCGQEQAGGAKSSKSSVINGQEAAPHQFPWLAHLQCQRGLGLYVCTSSIISENTILTAAHCVDGCDSITATVGVHNWRHPETEAQAIDATFTQHEEYGSTFLVNDIALVHLPEPIEIDNMYTMLSCLPTYSQVDEDFAGELTTVTGWGKTSDDSQASDVLYYIEDIPTIGNEECSAIYVAGTVQDQDICIDTTTGGTCNGDSGGPLNMYSADISAYLQIGVDSFGADSGCEGGIPSGYTRTTAFLDWIEANSDVVIEA